MRYDKLDKKQIDKIKDKVEVDSKLLNEVIDSIIKPYVKGLDAYIEFITECLADGEEPPTIGELEDFCMNLSTQIYWASGMCEQLGIKDDISRALYKEIYHTARDAQESGTVADKDSIAELAAIQEYLTSVCYNRAYKILKAKVENAQELLSSCKKVLSNRMSERELTRIGG